jgi:hypothetical protein
VWKLCGRVETGLAAKTQGRLQRKPLNHRIFCRFERPAKGHD